jgi:hypothetical protein
MTSQAKMLAKPYVLTYVACVLAFDVECRITFLSLLIALPLLYACALS